MKLKDFLNEIKYDADIPTLDIEAEFIPTDKPKECVDNSVLFVYRRVGGEYTALSPDIPKYIKALVCDYDYTVPSGITAIRIADVRRAYAYAHYLHNRINKSKMRLIAVTGTNGKTTTATIIHEILNGSGIKCGYIGTGKIKIGRDNVAEAGYSMTTPDPSLLYSALSKMEGGGCRAAVMEVSSHAIALGKVAPLTFYSGVFTNLSHEHMDFHTDIEEYYKTKLSLFAQCTVRIFNVDDEYGERAAEAYGGSAVTVGIINRADNYCTDITFSGADGSQFLYHGKRAITQISMKLPGAFNVYNAALAICCAVNLGVSPRDAKNALAGLCGVEGRMEKIHDNPTVIIDYAHTPYAMESAMKTLRAHKGTGRLITVFGCGGERDKEKRPLMGRIVAKYSDVSVITEDNSRGEEPAFIFSDILSGISDRDAVKVIPKREDAIIAALGDATAHDTVAIIGKGHEKYIIDNGGYRDFDERGIVAEYYSAAEDTANED